MAADTVRAIAAAARAAAAASAWDTTAERALEEAHRLPSGCPRRIAALRRASGADLIATSYRVAAAHHGAVAGGGMGPGSASR